MSKYISIRYQYFDIELDCSVDGISVYAEGEYDIKTNTATVVFNVWDNRNIDDISLGEDIKTLEEVDSIIESVT